MRWVSCRFSNPVYNERVVNWYSLSIYDDNVNNDIVNNNNNDSNDIIDVVHVDKLKVEYKENMKCDKYIYIFIDLSYVDFFYYKFTIITKIDVFKCYIDAKHIHEVYEIYYCKSQWKRNKLQLLFLIQIIR